MKPLIVKNSAQKAFVAAVLISALLFATFLTLEPTVMTAASATNDFTIRQQITGEISFINPADNVVMAGSIGGLLGGTSQGTTTVAVLTNNIDGYNMTIHFASTTAMLGETQGGSIANYAPAVAGNPDVNFIVPTGTAGFAYTAYPTDTADAVQRFEVNTTCNNGAGTPTLGSCWYGAANATTPVTIVNRLNATPATGATTTIAFRVGVDANPSPAVPEDYYTATATLTATEN
ncbi:hypothetical protein KC845_01760 [Candidatus Kaiserbacteria bacterium]|nr:hypothetical protein [Candidatus Kaiserbacteria bacterium]